MNASIPWSRDTRPIIAARLSSCPYRGDGVFRGVDGWNIERAEQNGEMAAVPFVRMTKGEVVIEARLSSFDRIELKDQGE